METGHAMQTHTSEPRRVTLSSLASVLSLSMSSQVRDEILHLFPYKAKLFFMEMLSVVLTPAVLCFSLPPCAPDILEFIRHHTTYVDGVGAVCDYSTFDLNKYGNEEFATNTKESTLLEVRVLTDEHSFLLTR